MNYLQKKKQAFMSIVNSIKGFVRNINGTPPITLEDCVDDHSLINYQIFGNSVQDGEPSPDAPVVVESVGEKTINLVNYKDFVKSGKTRKILYGIQFEITNSRIDIPIPITLKANTSYVLSADCTKDGFVGGLLVNNGTANDWCTKTRKNLYISNTTDTDINTHLRVVDTTGTQGSVVKNIMLIEGATAKEFVPYGYEIPVTASSETGESITTNIYLDEPLRKLGNYADYIDFRESKIYRYSAVKYITKNWSWTKNTSPTTNGMYGNYVSLDMERGTRLPGYCNVLPANKQGWNAWTYPQVHFGQANRAPYILTETQMATNEDLYNYLSNNGEVEPYIIYIKGDNDGIITPTEEELQLPSIPGLPTFKGNTTYKINTNTQPSNMAAEYYSTVKGD